MARFLAYVEPVPGRLHPLVPTLQELVRRGHRVAVRSGRDEDDMLRSLGIDAEPLAPEIVRFEPVDWRARTRFGALMSALGQFGERARFQLPDLRRALDAEHPDVVLVDETSWGAAAAAERSALPWSFACSRLRRCPRGTRLRSGSASPRVTTCWGACETAWRGR